MSGDAYVRCLETLAEKRNLTKPEIEQELQGITDEIFDNLSEDAQKRWLSVLKKQQRPPAEDLVECMTELLKIAER